MNRCVSVVRLRGDHTSLLLRVPDRRRYLLGQGGPREPTATRVVRARQKPDEHRAHRVGRVVHLAINVEGYVALDEMTATPRVVRRLVDMALQRNV